MNVTSMINCAACGHSNPEQTKFCGQCGRPVNRISPVAHVQTPCPQSTYVSGPSLLGLDAASQEEDDSVSYLLDEEPPSHAAGYFVVFIFVLAIIAVAAYFGYQRYYKPEPFSARAPQPIAPSFAYNRTSASVFEENKLALKAEPALPNRALTDSTTIENIANTMRRQSAHEQIGGVANTGSDKSARLVADGERYLYGRGVASNCKAAKKNFEDAAKQGDAAAMAHLGAMYGAGRCADFNRVTAYQWFARANNADPNNTWIQSSMDMLWRNMTAKERAAILK